jgi:Phage tail tube protein
MGKIATGVKKRIAYKKEGSTTWGQLAGATGAKQLRRVTGMFNLKKATYESSEIRLDYQTADMRHGIRSAEGSLNGELSPGTYSDLIGSLVAQDFNVSTAVTSPGSVTIAGTGPTYTVTRTTGSWITDAVTVGTVIRFTGLTTTADNAKNLLVTSLTATVATVVVLNGSSLTASVVASGAAYTVPGKNAIVPLTGHTDQSYTFEEFFTDINQSEVYTGMKVESCAIKIPASGFVTSDFAFKGKDRAQTGTAAYFTNPTALGTNSVLAAVNGNLVVNGVPVALLTSLDFTITRTLENAEAVGSNSLADMFTGRIKVAGSFSAYFTDGTFRDYFDNESVVSILVTVATGNTANAEFISFTIPKIKVGSADKDDKETGIMTTHSFTALLNSDVSTGLPATTIQICDSQAA